MMVSLAGHLGMVEVTSQKLLSHLDKLSGWDMKQQSCCSSRVECFVMHLQMGR
jgi:hypothetical protein